jgi:hypothetical protein
MLTCTRLIRFSDDEYVSAVTRTVDEARKPVEAGFECVAEAEGAKFFKRRGERLFEILKRHPNNNSIEDTPLIETQIGKTITQP